MTPQKLLGMVVLSSSLFLLLAGCRASPASQAETSAPGARAAPGAAPPQEAPKRLRKTGIGYVAVTASAATIWVAEEKGYFQKHGLEPEITYIQGGPAAIKAVMSGDLDFSRVPASAAALARAEGGDIAIIAVEIHSLPMEIWSKPAVARPQDLSGKTLAIDKRGGTTEFAARFLLKKWGLEPDRDVSLAEVGDMSAILGAMEAGAIDAGVVDALAAQMAAEKYQLRRLGGVRDEGLKYLFSTWSTRRSLIQQEPDTALAFVKGMVEGIATFKQDRAFAVDLIRRKTKTEDTTAVEKAWELYARSLLESVPYPSVEGYRTLQEELAATEPRLRDLKPEEIFEPRFVKELEQSGFIAGLYK